MNESIVNALMQLFALIATMTDIVMEESKARTIVRLYLKSYLSAELTEKYLRVYDKYYHQFLNSKSNKQKRLAVSSVKILRLAEKLNSNLNRLEKFVVLFRVIEYIKENGKLSKVELDLVYTLAETFTIEKQEFNNILFFIIGDYEKMPETDKILLVDNKKGIPAFLKNKDHYIYDENIDAPIFILYIASIQTFVFIYKGNFQLRLTGRNIIKDRVFIFDNGAIIRGNRIKPVYQTEIAGKFLFSGKYKGIRLVGKQIEFKFKNSDNGIHKVSFEFKSGQLVGILGGSGVGKSTFMNLLIGKYPLTSGSITINGYDIHKDKEKIEGLIGYVPQDDLLIEELTVFQNLYFNAKLCFGEKTKEQILDKVEKVLKELDLYEIRNLKVGNPLNKFISGGQRKRLNIALELIREPAILFVDEPTSGLSSTDSEIVMDLLKHQTLKGKLVLVNIHQPSSDIYKLFDKIWIFDKGGYAVYQGNPIDALIYFREASSFVNYQEVECPSCGAVHPEEVLDIIEEKIVDEFGRYSQERKVKPVEWYTLFRVNLEKRSRIKKTEKAEIPKTDFKLPSKLKQFFVFFQRDILSKISDKQYLLVNLLETPLLAIILAFFSKKIPDSGIYTFSENLNIPIFLFMTVVVAMFLGLSVSAEEIINDRKILDRERFLNLSRRSYLFSKIFILFMIGAYQTTVYLLISDTILDIRGVFWDFWIIMFSTMSVSQILGLNISAAFKSVVTVYVMIPLILVPEMLLGGAMIKYEDIYPAFSNKKYVPVIGDMMFARWAYEAMAVDLFKNNEYEKNFFEIDKAKSRAVYISAYLIPELQNYVRKINKGITDEKYKNATQDYLLTLKNEIKKIEDLHETSNIKFKFYNSLTYKDFGQISDSISTFLSNLKKIFVKRSNELTYLKDSLITSMSEKYGKNYLIDLKKNYYNEKLANIVLDKMRLKMFIHGNHELIRKKNPIFTKPDSKIGRAQLFAAEKYIGNYAIDTLTFNVAVLWLMTIFLYISLYYDWFLKLVEFLSSLKKNKR